MNPNKLDRRISVETKSTSLDANGDRVDTWTTILSSIPANVAPTGGKEFIRATRMFETASAVFMIRYRTNITQRDRILYNGRYYNIISIDEMGRKDGLLIVAESLNNKNATTTTTGGPQQPYNPVDTIPMTTIDKLNSERITTIQATSIEESL